MNAHIVAVFGQTRSGKDTFIEHLRGELVKETGAHVQVLSSIDYVKACVANAAKILGAPLPELDGKMRQCLASIKSSLDGALDWTPALAMRRVQLEVEAGHVPIVLIYQVREIANIEKLYLACKKQGIGYTPIFVHRPGITITSIGATTDRYHPNDWQIAKLVVINEDLDDMPMWALIAATKIRRDFKRADKKNVSGGTKFEST